MSRVEAKAPSRFRKKPVVVEAEQWTPGKSVPGVIEGEYIDDGHVFPAKIKTLEGWHGVSGGDFIIRGVKGERYPCRPDIFKMTYKPV